MKLISATAKATVDQALGGRLASLQVFGRELLVTAAGDPLHWGSYPMAPWAGRVRHGRFAHADMQYQLPLTMPPHAIHGTVLDRPWEQVSDGHLRIDLGSDWPFAGHAEQRFCIDDESLVMELSVHAQDTAFPASLGWHPYFLRDIGCGSLARLHLDAAALYADDDEQIPTGELVPPTAGPWDNCFTQLRSDPRICWPGFLELTLSSDCDHWVVYDRLDHACCVEPLSGPPNALNLQPRLVTPENPLKGTFTLRWTQDNAT